MGNHKDSGFQFLFCLEKGVDYSPAGFTVQVSRGFVGKENPGIPDECAGECDPLLLTAG